MQRPERRRMWNAKSAISSAVAVLLLLGAYSAGAGIVLSEAGNNLGLIDADDGDSLQDFDILWFSEWPFTSSHSDSDATAGASRPPAEQRPPSVVTQSYAFTDEAITTTFDLVTAPGGADPWPDPNGVSVSVARFQLYFEVGEPSTYALMGTMAGSDMTTDACMSQTVRLMDATDGNPFQNQIFFGDQWICDAPSGVLVVGGLGGDVMNELEGSTTGPLEPGRIYVLTAEMDVQAFTIVDEGFAAASGDFQMAVVSTHAVPGVGGLGAGVAAGLLCLIGVLARARASLRRRAASSEGLCP